MLLPLVVMVLLESDLSGGGGGGGVCELCRLLLVVVLAASFLAVLGPALVSLVGVDSSCYTSFSSAETPCACVYLLIHSSCQTAIGIIYVSGIILFGLYR